MYKKNYGFAARLILAACALSQIALGATLCVNKNGTKGCSSTIGAAVAAASAGDVIQVSQGTYHEDVVIGKSISLIGANSNNTIIDATGMSNGIYVDGLDNAAVGVVGISDVVVSGFTIQNANYEGILMTNATRITINGNQVLKNNVSLNVNDGTCGTIPNFETAEGFDCGEGIHLSGVDHSIISNNMIEHNAGGILLSDDTGATHDNLIMSNTVQENPFDCGITLASHPLYNPNPGPPTAAGVYHNTITGNTAKHNGFQVPGAGAGVGIFSPAPFTNNYANVVVNNDLIDNGLPGVALHAHAPGAGLNDNMIAGNRISGNAADTDDTSTSGPTGINVSGGDNGAGVPLAVITGTVIAGNVIEKEAVGVATKTSGTVSANLNDFNAVVTGVDNIFSGPVNALFNWWGCAKGPNAPGCAGTTGTNILDVPFATTPF